MLLHQALALPQFQVMAPSPYTINSTLAALVRRSYVQGIKSMQKYHESKQIPLLYFLPFFFLPPPLGLLSSAPFALSDPSETDQLEPQAHRERDAMMDAV